MELFTVRNNAENDWERLSNAMEEQTLRVSPQLLGHVPSLFGSMQVDLFGFEQSLQL